MRHCGIGERRMISIPEPDLAGRRLLNGQHLATNEYIRSPNDRFFAIMQGDDEHLVLGMRLYRRPPPPRWSHPTG